MSKSRKRGKGTAAKSLSLTYAQLEFLDGLDNASAWVREAIDEILEIRKGNKIVLDRPLAEFGGSYWARLVERGFEARESYGLLGAFDQVIEAALDLEKAYEEAKKLDAAAGGSGEKPFNAFHMPAYQVASDIKKIIKNGQQPPP